MNCRFCKNIIDNNARICPVCGASQDPSVGIRAPQNAPSRNDQISASIAASSRRKLTTMMILTYVTIAISALVYFGDWFAYQNYTYLSSGVGLATGRETLSIYDLRDMIDLMGESSYAKAAGFLTFFHTAAAIVCGVLILFAVIGHIRKKTSCGNASTFIFVLLILYSVVFLITVSAKLDGMSEYVSFSPYLLIALSIAGIVFSRNAASAATAIEFHAKAAGR